MDNMSSNPHKTGSSMHAEHAAVFNLVAHADATHVAQQNGSWFDPGTWSTGVVPGDGARVVIPEHVAVSYDDISDTRLFTVRVDGQLDFATQRDTRMVVDTMVVDMTGTLTIGTVETPVADGVTADIVVANNGGIDVAWDPMLLSRGVISHGAVSVHGAEKTTHLKVATDPMAGDTSLTLAEAPSGWKVGDTIVLAGTRHDGHKWDNDIGAVRYHEAQDEVLTITAIDGATVQFDRPLAYNHDTPRADLKTSVANYSRNVTIGTEAPETAAVHERGHVMFMHSNDVDVRYAAFHELGRTDKSVRAFDATEITDIAADSNVKGRYPVHLHRTGTADQMNPVVMEGNAVFGSPGWGFTHHDSHAILHDNATYDTFGAGFVAETGNETGQWTSNIAIDAEGLNRSVKDGPDANAFDLGRTGDGFWFQGRLVESAGNIAASVNNGFVYMHRGPGMLPIPSQHFDFPEALGLREAVGPEDAPILHFRDNEAFAIARDGLHVVKANPDQGHDIHTHLKYFTAWSVVRGAHIEYTSHYILEGFDVVGRDPERFSKPATGISLGNNSTDITIINPTVAGFTTGIGATKRFTFEFDPAKAGYAIIDSTITDTGTAFVNLDEPGEILTGADVVPGRFEVILDHPLTYKEGWPDPDARKVAIRGTKTDSLGEGPLPAGSDSYDVDARSVINILETDGFYLAADGTHHFVLEGYYSDRVTGEIHKIGHIVEIDPNVGLQNPYFIYNGAVFAGTIDLNSKAPVTKDETAQTDFETDVIIDVLANASDPDGDPLEVDGIVQPDHGRVFDNGDGTVTYRPDFDFSGTDSFRYWVTDNQGNFTPATVSVEVAPPALAVDEPPLDVPVDDPAPVPVDEGVPDDGPVEVARAIMETGTLMLDHNVKTITLETAFEDPVVVASVASKNGAHPVLVKVVEAVGSTLSLALQEPDYLDGRHSEEKVNYMVVEAGDWILADGTRLSAGEQAVMAEGKDGFAAVTPSSPIAKEAVFLTHIQNSADPDFLTSRVQRAHDGSFEVGVDQEEGNRSPLDGATTVGWIAIDDTATTGDSFDFIAGRAGNVDDNVTAIQFGNAPWGTAVNAITAMSSYNGADTAWTRIVSETAAGFEVFVEEEQSRDAETRHTGEVVEYFAFADPGVISGSPLDLAIL